MRCETKWDHSFQGSICEWCGISQQAISDTGLKKIEIKQKPTLKITSEFQWNIQQICDYLKLDVKKKGNFPMIAGIYKRLGKENIFNIISYMKSRRISSIKYFMGCVKKKGGKM